MKPVFKREEQWALRALLSLHVNLLALAFQHAKRGVT